MRASGARRALGSERGSPRPGHADGHRPRRRADERVPADVLAVTGASMATLLAGIPFNGPMAAVRVGLLGDDFVLNPSFREMERGDLDLVVAGTPDGVVMVEAAANQLTEQDVIEAVDFGSSHIKSSIGCRCISYTKIPSYHCIKIRIGSIMQSF